MFEYIGNKLRASLAASPMITRPGGLAEVIDTVNGNERTKYPGCKGYRDKDGVYTGKTSDIMNLSPDASAAGIAFTDFPSDITVEQNTGRYQLITVRFRVVVWYNEDAMDYQGEVDKGGRLMQEVIDRVNAAEMPFFKKSKINLEAISADASRIWSVYSFKPDDALFLPPYRTFAIIFRMRAYLMKGCELPEIEVDQSCC
mgnify:FL=1